MRRIAGRAAVVVALALFVPVVAATNALAAGLFGTNVVVNGKSSNNTSVRGYSWTMIPITWRNRRTGISKLKLSEMGSRYLFIALYCWLEKYFSRGDYRKRQ